MILISRDTNIPAKVAPKNTKDVMASARDIWK